MPLSVSAYFAAYLTFSLWSHVNGFKKKKYHPWFATADGVSTACLILAALSFWLPLLSNLPAPVLLGLFTVSCAILLGLAIEVCRRYVADPSLSPQSKLFVAISSSAFGIAINSPLLFWGFTATVLGKHGYT